MVHRNWFRRHKVSWDTMNSIPVTACCMSHCNRLWLMDWHWPQQTSRSQSIWSINTFGYDEYKNELPKTKWMEKWNNKNWYHFKSSKIIKLNSKKWRRKKIKLIKWWWYWKWMVRGINWIWNKWNKKPKRKELILCECVIRA